MKKFKPWFHKVCIRLGHNPQNVMRAVGRHTLLEMFDHNYSVIDAAKYIDSEFDIFDARKKAFGDEADEDLAV